MDTDRVDAGVPASVVRRPIGRRPLAARSVRSRSPRAVCAVARSSREVQVSGHACASAQITARGSTVEACFIDCRTGSRRVSGPPSARPRASHARLVVEELIVGMQPSARPASAVSQARFTGSLGRTAAGPHGRTAAGTGPPVRSAAGPPERLWTTVNALLRPGRPDGHAGDGCRTTHRRGAEREPARALGTLRSPTRCLP